MLDAFYGAFSPACFALLGLWLVVVQMRLPQWQGAVRYRRGAYGVALHFALPGVMSMFALIDAQDPVYWRVSFAVVALGGAVVMTLVRGYIVRPAAEPGSGHRPALAAADQLGLAAYVLATALYLIIGVLAVIGGVGILRAEASLLTVLVFLGFNAAWLLLFDGGSTVHDPARPE
jgi:hypothetical protein